MLVTNPRKQKLLVQVKDALGFMELTIGSGEVSNFPQVIVHKVKSFDFSF